MTEEQIKRELIRIAISEIGKKNVASASVTPVADSDDREALEIIVMLKPDAPDVSGKTYMSVLLKAYDLLGALKDQRRPGLFLDRLPTPSVSATK